MKVGESRLELYFSHQLFFPRILRKYFGFISIDNKKKYFIVGSPLSKKYTNVLTKDKKPLLNAYKQLADFLKIINDSKKLDIILKSKSYGKELFYFYKTTPWKKPEYFKRNIKGLQDKEFLPQSILTFSLSDEIKNDNAIFSYGIVTSRTSPTHRETFPPLIYINKKWHIAVLNI